MLTAQKTRVRYSPELSLKIGQYASQQRLAYNQGVEHTLAHPNISKNEIQHQLTLWREQGTDAGTGPLLWANGPTKEAVETRRRTGVPPLSDSLTLVLGRPGPKLDPSREGKPEPKAPGPGPGRLNQRLPPISRAKSPG